MNIRNKALLTTTAAALLSLAAIMPANAETAKTTTTETTVTTTTQVPTVTTTTTRTPVVADDVTLVNFMQFDKDENGVLTADEVGTALFYIFDTDGNEIVDNIEFDQKRVYTLQNVKEVKTVRVDLDNDGVDEIVERDVDVFLKETSLAKFGNGDSSISAADFTGKSFLQMDINNDKAVDLAEFKRAYLESIPLVAEQGIYNQ